MLTRVAGAGSRNLEQSGEVRRIEGEVMGHFGDRGRDEHGRHRVFVVLKAGCREAGDV